MIELLYVLAKDIKEYLEWNKDIKVVDREWLEKSEFDKHMGEQGYTLYWSKPEKIETRKLEGYEIMYEIDKKNRIKLRIERRSGGDSLVLMGKKK